MNAQALRERAHLHIRRHFARHIPAHMRFHDLEHTLSVTRAALEIGRAERFAAHELLLLELAALFHDTGYAQAYDGHELHSARIAEHFLRQQGVTGRDIKRIVAAIKATRLGARPRGRLQQVLRDADSAKAGQVDFDEKSERLRKELESVAGRRLKNREWAHANLEYLERHSYQTAYARKRFGAQKELNLERARQRVADERLAAKGLKVAQERFFDRDLSWLSFNDRVMQEAQDPQVPLLERIKFLAIYSSNLDEFYRVRVASLRGLSVLAKRDRSALGITPDKLIAKINRKALRQQQEFGRLFRGELLPALAREGIRFLNERQLSRKQRAFVLQWFQEQVVPHLHTAELRRGNAPFIEDRKLYLACQLRTKGSRKVRRILVNVPAEETGRFLALPGRAKRTDLMFLDDVMRIGLPHYFKAHGDLDCHAIKLSRDADLYLEEEFAGSVVERVRKSLKKRQTGPPSRLLFDHAMPRVLVRGLRELLGLKSQEMVAGGRYHNFSDLHNLPVKGRADLRDPVLKPLPHPVLSQASDLFQAMAASDHLLQFPYQDFGILIRWLNQAALDPAVRRISITLYRVAKGSLICEALLTALRHGKHVRVFVEVLARFDESSNLYWGDLLERAGAEVMYSHEGVKVHCKLCQVERVERGRTRLYTYLGTGNFNENTSRLYADSALLTASAGLGREVAEVFHHLRDRTHQPRVERLLVAPMGLRSGLEALIDREIENALQGHPARITLKVNSLEDRALIRKLYDADRAGVHVRCIVRGICCLVPGVKEMSRRTEVISIVDRYLEHARIMVFHARGRDQVFLSSADWMGRNLDRRVEVAFPIQDPGLAGELITMLELQWADDQKARIVDAGQRNLRKAHVPGHRPIRSQAAFRTYLSRKASAPKVTEH